ncbi:MAG: N-acetylmuramoyl-L-alanine amidase [Muribaculaceae bacterium]|nr:N-acetylmuramoyl-L-alanine amidase [Muribaculaceae bacterium]
MKNTPMRIIAFISRCIAVAAILAAGCLCAQAKDAKADFTLAIDAGHGGHDKGCNSGKNYEKNITLDVAKRLHKLVNKNCGDSVDVVMTRSTDIFVPLDKRAKIANEAGADLFISIHVNSIDKRSKGRHLVHGASVYTVGLHKSKANLNVAMRENAVIELEEDYTATYQGFDPNSSESYIIFELGQNRNMAQSIDFASLAQNELVSTAGRADKGVRQAGFLVLWATKMPAVLVELDFICNAAAERFLASESGRQKCAQALFNAFMDYRRAKLHSHAN